jgi:hypothetical protein
MPNKDPHVHQFTLPRLAVHILIKIGNEFDMQEKKKRYPKMIKEKLHIDQIFTSKIKQSYYHIRNQTELLPEQVKN